MEAIAGILIHFWGVRTLVGEASLEPGEPFTQDDDIVVLCDSFSDGERQQWVDRVRRFSSTLLVVKIDGFDAGPHAGSDAMVDYDHGPAALVATIYELLTERGLASRGWVDGTVQHYLQ